MLSFMVFVLLSIFPLEKHCCLSVSQHHNWVFLLLLETENADVFITVCPKYWADYYVLIYSHRQELMKSVGRHCFFVMKVLVQPTLSVWLSLPWCVKVLLLRFICNVIDIYFLYISSRKLNISCAYFTQKTDPRKLALKSSVLDWWCQPLAGWTAFPCCLEQWPLCSDRTKPYIWHWRLGCLF